MRLAAAFIQCDRNTIETELPRIHLTDVALPMICVSRPVNKLVRKAKSILYFFYLFVFLESE